MFPISWDKMFRKKDGSLVTMDEAISGGGGGGGGGGSLHLFKVTTNQIAVMTAYVLTTVDAEITSVASLKTALETGFGFVTGGYISGASTSAPTFLVAEDNKVTVKYFVPSGGRNCWSSYTITSGDISSAKIF